MQKIKEAFQRLCTGNSNKKISFTVNEKIQIYQDVVSGNLETIKEIFQYVDRWNLESLKFTNVKKKLDIHMICIH